RGVAHAEGLAAGHVAGQALGYQAGYAQGRATGFDAGRAEAHTHAAQLAALAASFRDALAGVVRDLADDIATLALEIAQQDVRQHVPPDPAALISPAREGLGAEPALAGAPHLIVNAADLPVVEAYLKDELDPLGWSVRTDTSIERGGCRAHASTGEIDAARTTRWERVAAALGKGRAW
ncbi:flagellar assembly protein FliH, partial [Burkholderia pseudomallei]|uniref:flagellar assembly protein FliH n=1 Tax=Burkholderia pseudomallei TaxID=28450 RepID=UPI0021F7D737